MEDMGEKLKWITQWNMAQEMCMWLPNFNAGLKVRCYGDKQYVEEWYSDASCGNKVNERVIYFNDCQSLDNMDGTFSHVRIMPAQGGPGGQMDRDDRKEYRDGAMNGVTTAISVTALAVISSLY